MITKLQQGGQMEQQLVQLVQAAMSGDQKATQQIDNIMQAAQQGDQQAIQIANYIQKIAKQLQGSIKAKLGTKLTYYDYLKNPTKYQRGGSFKQAWNNARNAGNRYFWYNGKTYNTKKQGESDAYWGTHFRDNSTSGGADNIQTDVGLSGGWEGEEGANIGRYNSQGQWIRSKQNTLATPSNAVYGARGDNTEQSNYKIFAPIDRPIDQIQYHTGTNKRIQTTNTRTGMTVGGQYPKGKPGTFAGHPQRRGTTFNYNYMPGGYQGAAEGTFNNNPIVPHEGNQKIQNRKIRIPIYSRNTRQVNKEQFHNWQRAAQNRGYKTGEFMPYMRSQGFNYNYEHGTWFNPDKNLYLYATPEGRIVQQQGANRVPYNGIRYMIN